MYIKGMRDIKIKQYTRVKKFNTLYAHFSHHKINWVLSRAVMIKISNF